MMTTFVIGCFAVVATVSLWAILTLNTRDFVHPKNELANKIQSFGQIVIKNRMNLDLEHNEKLVYNKILYFEKVKAGFLIHLYDGRIKNSETSIRGLMADLPFSFINCNDAYWVNASNIKKINKRSITFLNNSQLAISIPKTHENF